MNLSPIKRRSVLQGMAALGSTGQHSDAVVREHVAWALAQAAA